MTRDKFYSTAARFSKARLGVRPYNAGPEKHFREVYCPSLGGELIRPKCMPKYGYATRAEALEGGRRYRDDCRAIVNDPDAFDRISQPAEGAA